MTKRYPENDLAGCLGSLFALGGIILYQRFRKPPAEKLLALNQNLSWGDEVQIMDCPSCDTQNEQGRTVCFHCGFALESPSQQSSEAEEQVPKWLLWVTIIFAVMFFYFLAG